jgi:hypothetical protein
LENGHKFSFDHKISNVVNFFVELPFLLQFLQATKGLLHQLGKNNKQSSIYAKKGALLSICIGGLLFGEFGHEHEQVSRINLFGNILMTHGT